MAAKGRKKRANGAGSVYQRSRDGRWVGVLSLPDGRRRTVTAGTRRDALDRLSALQREGDRGVDAALPRQTVEAYLERWLLDGAKPGLRPRTYAGYAQIVRDHLTPSLGARQLAALTPQQVQAMLNAKVAAGLTPRTVHYIRAVLRRALGQAMKWELVTRNVAALTDAPRMEYQERQPLAAAQVRALLAAAAGHRFEALLHVAVSLGMRQGELLGLRWRDVELDGGQLHVRHAMQRVDGAYHFVEPKTKKSRRAIPLAASLVAVLRAHQARQDGLRGGAGWREHDLVFCTEAGLPLHGTVVTRSFQKLMGRAGLPVIRFHDLRHTAATLMLAKGVPDRVVIELFGWTDATMLHRYQHAMPEMKRAAVEAVASLLEH